MSQEVERWKRDLNAAGWLAESATAWRAPDGSLWRGPYGAWKELQGRIGGETVVRMITWECDDSECDGVVVVAECYEAGSCPVCEGPMHETMNYED